MEYVEGDTLGAVIRRGGVSLHSIVQVVCEVPSALEAAHAIGIVHRDLKPANILVTSKGHAKKIVDFGIAKLAPSLRSSAEQPAHTQTGALLGTPAYMAPEQIDDPHARPRQRPATVVYSGVPARGP